MTRFEEKTYNTSSLNIGLWKSIFNLMNDQKRDVYKLALTMSILTLCETAFPLMYKYAIDEFAVGLKDISFLKYFILIFFINVLICTFSCFLFFRQAGKIEMYFGYSLRKRCMEKLQNLSFSYYDVTPSGWIVARVSNDIARLAEIVSWSFLDILSCGLSIIFVSVAMISVNVKLALSIIIVIPILFVISMYFQNLILKYSRKVRSCNSTITNDFNECIMGAKTTKTLCLEKQNLNQFRTDIKEMRRASIKMGTTSSIFLPICGLFSSLCFALIIYNGGNSLLSGAIEVGVLMMFSQYLMNFFENIRYLARLVSDLQLAQASGERVVSLLNTQPSITDSDEVIMKYGTKLNQKMENYEPVVGKVVFEHVDFGYNTKKTVLKDFNLTVEPGKMVALVGETGSGKSTIINLLCRFYEPTSGSIKIDDVDYRKRSLGWLHSNIGYVLQSPHLFSGTILDNIRYGNHEASLEDVKEVCRMLQADKFIEQFPDGYYTEVKEGGNLLSTGQKQMISFARALIKNPKIYILDEATSSIDTQTEQVIQYAIDHIMKNHTSFVVAHRLSTIVNADMILVINNGMIIEKGTHEELMAKKGKYFTLYNNQFLEDMSDNMFDLIKD